MWEVLGLVAGGWALLSGGAFLTFSTLVMTGVGRLGVVEGVEVMRQVNLAAPRSPVFMATVFGPGVLGVVVGVHALVARPDGWWLAAAGAAAYVVGVVGTTVAFHVPRNVRLEAMDDGAAHLAWRRWARVWTAGNHVRVVAAVLGGCLLLLGSR